MIGNEDHGAFGFVSACIAGAIVSAMSRKEISVWQRFTEASCGSLAAYYGGIFVIGYYEVPPEYVSPAGFVLGLVGMEVSRIIIEFTRHYGPIFLKKKTGQE